MNTYIAKAGGSFQHVSNNLATNEAEILHQLCLVGAWKSGRLNLHGLWSMTGDEMEFCWYCLVESSFCRRTFMRRLTTCIRSEKCVVRRFRRCANVIVCTYIRLDSIAYYTPRLYGIAYCS
jgi:hypothetical protein